MSTSSLLQALDRLSQVRVGIIGDLVADLYVSGQSDRVSREAPVLILRYEKEWLRPGGAANVAANVAALGARAVVVGLVGEDEPGRRLVAELSRNAKPGAVDCDRVVAAADRATITKTRFIAGARLTSRQQVLRLDRQPDDLPSKNLLARLRDHVIAADAQIDAWVVSDYGYGAFDDALRATLRDIAKRKPVVADSRFELSKYTGMTVLKPNEEEAVETAKSLGISVVQRDRIAAELNARLQASATLMTLGNEGMLLHAGGRSVHIDAVGTEEIVDLTGAGDTVAATLAAALAGGAEIDVACRLANHAGSIVVMKEGAATASPDELRRSIQKNEASA